VLLLLCSEGSYALIGSSPLKHISAEQEQPDVAGELDAFLRELQAGIPPEGALADREFVIPEGFPVEAAKEIWHSVALLVSCGASDEEVREALALLDKRVKLPGEIKMGDDNFTIRYDQARVGWEDDGRVFVDIPIETPLLGGVSANMVHIRSIAVSGRLHLVYRITEERLYRLRRRLEGYYRISYRDLETGKNYSVVSRLTLGVYPEFGISTGASGSEIPPGSIFNFGKYTPGFLVAVPGHYEDVDVLVPEHYEKFKVLFPAYDPVLYTGWIVDTSISSSNVELHDVLAISYEAYPVNIDPDDEPLNANLYLGAPGSFEPLDGVVAELNNTHRSGSFRLRANAAGTYDVTLNLSGNACFGGWPPQTSTTYVVNVVGPSSPEVEIEFTGVEPSFKHASVDVNVKNDGAGDAHNVTLDISGNVDPLSFGVGELKAGLSWSNRITLRLRSASARVRACATYFDDSGNRYVSDRYITIVSPNYVVPEHFEEYTLKVPEHFEKVRVFVPGYEGYTHVKIYHPYCTFYYPSGLGLGGPGVVLSAEGVEVHTTFLPIADEGFELTFVPKELKMNILGEVLVGPNIPASGVFTTTAQVRYLVTSVTPAFEEFVVDERKAREMLGLSGVGEIKAEEVPAGYEAALESTIVKRERLWLNETEYRRVAEEGFGRVREGFYYYEDGGEAIWPSADSARSLSGLEAELFGNKIRLIYHPLELHEGNSVRGISLRNYASRSLNYSVQVEPVSLLPASAKAQSGSIVAPAASCLELSMFQLVSDVTFIVSLRYGDRQVARLYLMRTLAVPPYCQGFIRGFLSKAPSIAIPVCFLGIAAIAPSSVVRGLSYAVIVAKAVEVYSQREQLIGAALTLANLTALSMEHNRLAAAYAAMGKPQLARKALETSASLSAQALDVAKDLGLGLFVGVDPQELKVALGYTEANEYERGYAAGRVAGSIVAAVAYVGTFTVLYDKLAASGGAGQLSTASILSRVGKGLYNWLTPSIWDLAELGMAKVRDLTVKHAAEVMLADQIDRGFGSVAGEAARVLLTDGGKADVAEAVADIVEKTTLDGELPEDVAAKLLAALEPVGRAYVGDGEWGAKVRRVAYDVLEVWKREGAVGDALMDWLKGSQEEQAERIADEVLIKLKDLGDDALKSLEAAIEAVGADRSAKFLEAYFKASGRYAKNMIDLFVGCVAKHPEQLEMWSDAFARSSKMAFLEFKTALGGFGIRDLKVVEGVYRVWVVDPEPESMGVVAEGFREIEVGQRSITFSGAEMAPNREYLTIFMPYGVEDFFSDLKLKGVESDFVKLGDGRVQLLTGDGKLVAEPYAFLRERVGQLYLEFELTDVDGKTCTFRLTDEGKLSLVDVEEGSIRYYNVIGLRLRHFDDDAGGEAVRLLGIEYGKRTTYLVMARNIPGDVTYCLDDKDRFIEVEPGQQTKKVGEVLEVILGKDGFDKFDKELAAGRAVVGLVYVGEDGGVHHLWSTSLEYNLRNYPAKEVLRLYIVKIEGTSGVDLGRASVRLVSGEGGYQLLVEGVKGLESIPVDKPYIEVGSHGPNVKMPLRGGEVLGIFVGVDDQGRLYYSRLKIQDGNAFYDLKLLNYFPQLEIGDYEENGITLNDLLAVKYKDSSGEDRVLFISLRGDAPKEILHRLNYPYEHTLLEVEAMNFFESRGEEVTAIEKWLEKVSGMEKRRVIDVTTQDQSGTEVLIECKHGDESVDIKQVEDYFAYSKARGSKLRLYIKNDITSSGMKSYVRRAIELHEQTNVSLEIYIKGEFKSLEEVKEIVGEPG
jgi:hypothetical protein